MTQPSLRVLLPVALACILLGVSALSFTLSLGERQKDLSASARAQMLTDAARLVRLADDPQGLGSTLLRAEIAQIAGRPEVDRVLVIDPDGLVLAGSRSAWQGRSVADLAPALDSGRLGRAVQGRLPDWQVRPGGDAMDALQSFGMPSQPGELRSFRRGLVYVAYDLRKQRAEATRAELLSRLPDAIGLLAVFLLMGWWIGRQVSRPLAQLDAAADRLRQGDWAVHIPQGGAREIRQLAQGLDALRQELAATWRAVPDLMFELDEHGRYLRVVASRSDLVVRDPMELIGRLVSDVLPPSAAAVVHLALSDAARQGAVWGRELALDVPAGQRWFEISVARKSVLGQRAPTFLLISRDITDRKHAEATLREVNEVLEQRVEGRTAELLAAKNDAERANRAKSEFLSRMSHELRTPLNAILGFGQLLELSVQDPKQCGQVRHILGAGRHLLDLINEILDLARVESGQMTVSMSPVGVSALVQECLELVRPLADAHGVRLVCDRLDDEVHVMADHTRLRQVLINLLSNGVKYNRHGGTLGLTWQSEGDEVVIRVSDTGEGLPPEALSRLFVPFERLDADARQIEGTGIGLALSKHLVTLMGGRIGAHSEPGQGSVFWVALACCQPTAAPQPLSSQAAC